MELVGPDSFEIVVDPNGFEVRHGDRLGRFTPRACSRVPKLYVVANARELAYVGVTKQPMRNRLRLGWTAKGQTGYYGYAWRHAVTCAALHVWYHQDAKERSCRDVETVEAEVAFLVRSAGQWPAHQTEIHFYPSSEIHRDHAKRIFDFVTAAS